MTGRAPATTRRSRSPAFGTLLVLVLATSAAACGSEAPESGEPLPDSGTAAASPATEGSGAASATEPAAAATPGPAPTPAPGDEAPEPVVSPPPVAAPQPAPQPAPPPPGPQDDGSQGRSFPSGEVWEALRQCESLGDYGFVHPSGEYFGAYQFTVATWDRLATQRYTDLAGVLPSEAAPADQDRMAYYLWIESGSAPWPACSHVFTGDPPPEGTAAVVGAPPAPPTPDEAAAETPEEGAAPETGAGESAPEGTDDGSTEPQETPEPETDPSLEPAVPPDVPGFPTPEQWEALRQCESTGNYQAVSRNGLYYGAYQFWPDTWDFVATRNYPRLVDVLPSEATPQDQTRMAYRLWEERGDQPWPVCGRYLRDGG